MQLWMYPDTTGWFAEDDNGQMWRVPHEPNGWAQRKLVVPGVDAPIMCGLYRRVNRYAELPLMRLLGMPVAE